MLVSKVLTLPHARVSPQGDRGSAGPPGPPGVKGSMVRSKSAFSRSCCLPLSLCPSEGCSFSWSFSYMRTATNSSCLCGEGNGHLTDWILRYNLSPAVVFSNVPLREALGFDTCSAAPSAEGLLCQVEITRTCKLRHLKDCLFPSILATEQMGSGNRDLLFTSHQVARGSWRCRAAWAARSWCFAVLRALPVGDPCLVV